MNFFHDRNLRHFARTQDRNSPPLSPSGPAYGWRIWCVETLGKLLGIELTRG